MPRANQFRHQRYQSERPTSPYRLLPAVSPTQPQTAEFAEQMASSAAAFGQEGVAAVYCVHGTHSGNDALGLLTELSRFLPRLSKSLSRLGKRSVDLIVGETGNYTPEYAATMQANLSAGAGRTIPVRLFNWSSQNSHIGRADGAIKLIDELAHLATSLAVEKPNAAVPPRIVLWGHSHAGNVFSLLTNLLGSDAAAQDEFFEVARPFYSPWLRSEVDMPVWPRVQQLLADKDHPLRRLKLDIVTFGTPIRYGWDTDGYDRLLHFVYHRPCSDAAEYLAPQSVSMRRLLSAADGDYIQQLGIAGTNLLTIPIALRTLQADWRLAKFLEKDVAHESLFQRIKHGTRVHDEGNTLLVDYDEIKPWVYNHLAGHAVYTRSKWLAFHCSQVAEEFYGKQ